MGKIHFATIPTHAYSSAEPVPKLLYQVLGDILWPYLAVHSSFASPQIDILRARCGNLPDKCNDPPNGVENDKNWNTNVGSDEVVNSPISFREDFPSV